MNKHLVFVYGTLRRGGPNHYMLAEADYLGPHWTPPRFTMFRLGQFPAVVPRGETVITGEVYRVDDAVFGLLDELECYPQVFSRQRIETPPGHGQRGEPRRLAAASGLRDVASAALARRSGFPCIPVHASQPEGDRHPGRDE